MNPFFLKVLTTNDSVELTFEIKNCGSLVIQSRLINQDFRQFSICRLIHQRPMDDEPILHHEHFRCRIRIACHQTAWLIRNMAIQTVLLEEALHQFL